MESNKYTEFILLELIMKSTKFREEYCIKYKSQDINTRLFSADNSCSCKTELVQFYIDNQEDINKFISEFLVKNEGVINLKDFIARIESKYIGGKTYRIQSTDTSFADFVDKINKEQLLYRSVNAIKDGDTLIFLFF